MFALCLNKGAVTDQVERLVLGGGFPARLRWARFNLDDFIQNVLPSALGDQRITPHQIRAGDLKIDGGLLMRLVLGVENTLGRSFVPRFETFLFASRVVLNEKNPGVPFEETVFTFHRHHNF